ncbi:MAG: 2-oxoacid:acceptor oxidoreductase family protein [Candidatus Stygibacter australis]|nr:2-oxoacid:acceptor oxidoreductase family protein [Candidatus Stygibacter australis]MDP8322494.1 2-oxoacid:acceptor oxidoreductase family protein [Candidatus Stygibacter australis]
MSNHKGTIKKQVRLSGSGGQGLLTAGLILSEAATLQGLNVTQTQSYGAASRGGSSRSDVVISNEPIFFPEATHFDSLIALTQESCDKFFPNLRDGGVLIIDTIFVKNYTITDQKIYALPFTQIAIEKLGSSLPTNIMALSFLVRVTNIVTEKYLKEAIKAFKPEFSESNLKAMKLAFKLADEYGESNQEKV